MYSTVTQYAINPIVFMYRELGGAKYRLDVAPEFVAVFDLRACVRVAHEVGGGSSVRGGRSTGRGAGGGGRGGGGSELVVVVCVQLLGLALELPQERLRDERRPLL